jgi:hypothetical protein
MNEKNFFFRNRVLSNKTKLYLLVRQFHFDKARQIDSLFSIDYIRTNHFQISHFRKTFRKMHKTDIEF